MKIIDKLFAGVLVLLLFILVAIGFYSLQRDMDLREQELAEQHETMRRDLEGRVDYSNPLVVKECVEAWGDSDSIRVQYVVSPLIRKEAMTGMSYADVIYRMIDEINELHRRVRILERERK